MDQDVQAAYLLPRLKGFNRAPSGESIDDFTPVLAHDLYLLISQLICKHSYCDTEEGCAQYTYNY